FPSFRRISSHPRPCSRCIAACKSAKWWIWCLKNPSLELLPPWRERVPRSKIPHSTSCGENSLLVNLLRCMPTDLVFEEFESGPTSRRTIRFLRPIVATDWDRLRLYGYRVKHLWSGLNQQVSLTEIFPTLSMCLVDDRLMPNLSTLHWSHSNIEFSYIHLFLTSKITTLRLSFDDECPDLSLLAMLPRACPTLKDVSILLHRSPRQFTKVTRGAQASISRFIHGLHHLEKLNMWIPDVAALEHLGRLPALRALELRSLPAALAASPSSQMRMFANLGDLALRATDLGAATEFLGIVVGACLKSVFVRASPVGSIEQLENFSGALALCSRSHTTLTSLRIDNSDNSAAVYLSGDPSSSNLLRTLFCFGQLRDIDIHSDFGFDLDDTDLSDMARAWPALESLDLQGRSKSMPRATLQSLRMIAQYCPRLHTLRIAFDAIIPPPTDETSEHVSQHSLTSLHVEESGINPRTLPIAHFLSRIFPNLNIISTAREYDDDDDEFEADISAEEMDFHHRWKQVESQLDELAMNETPVNDQSLYN
ncbi:hypothetical protein C8R44DRAFT_190855, partial [Mycena epipterygia]